MMDLRYGYPQSGDPATGVLRGASLTLDAGEIVALRGRSGSGKSTLLHCAAGVLPVSAGSVTVSGVELAGLDEQSRRRVRLRHVGLVLQDGHLLPELTAQENVALPLQLLGASRSGARRRARQVLQGLGLGDQEASRPSRLSGGQAQRVAIARALACQPGVLLADEPTGALDATTADTVLDLLVAACRTDGSALVLVTHDPLVARRADRCLTMQDGVVHDSAADET